MSRVDGHHLVREFMYHLHPVHLVGIPGVWGDAKLPQYGVSLVDAKLLRPGQLTVNG
jgi:hypothetical protein